MIIVFYKETINTSAIDYLLLQGEIHIDVAAMLKQKVMMVMMPPRVCFTLCPSPRIMNTQPWLLDKSLHTEAVLNKGVANKNYE